MPVLWLKWKMKLFFSWDHRPVWRLSRFSWTLGKEGEQMCAYVLVTCAFLWEIKGLHWFHKERHKLVKSWYGTLVIVSNLTLTFLLQKIPKMIFWMSRVDNIPMETQQGQRILSGQSLKTDDLDYKALSQDVGWDIYPYPSSLDLQDTWPRKKETLKRFAQSVLIFGCTKRAQAYSC